MENIFRTENKGVSQGNRHSRIESYFKKNVKWRSVIINELLGRGDDWEIGR